MIGNTDANLESFKIGALNFANEIRAKFGLKPAKRLAKGQPKDPLSCPITNTIVGRSRLMVSTGCDQVKAKRHDEDTRIFDVNDAAFDFISYFDDGQYPELIRR